MCTDCTDCKRPIAQWQLCFLKLSWLPSYIGVTLSLTFTFILSPISIYFGVKREMYSIQIPVIAWGFVTPCFLLYHAVHSLLDFESCNLNSGTLSDIFEIDNDYAALMFTLLAVGVIFVRSLVIIVCIITTIHFQRGLKDVFAGRDTSSIFEKHEEMSRIQALLDLDDDDESDDSDHDVR